MSGDSRNIDANARSMSSVSGDVPKWVRDYPVPEQLHDYLFKRRQALLLEVAEIEKILNIAPRKAVRNYEL
jgi:hypothetical protein